jgi:hypothetical protein
MRYAMREVVKEWEGERNVGRDTIVRGADDHDGGIGSGLAAGLGLGAGAAMGVTDEESIDDGVSDYASIMDSDIIEY